jgi:hypothetical protein
MNIDKENIDISELEWTELDQSKYANEKREDYIKRMEEQGYKIVIPTESQLQIDIDSDGHYKVYKEMIKLLLRDYESVIIEEHPSRNGLPGRHITLTIPFFVDAVQRIAWQTVLGSDPVREYLSLQRSMQGDISPTLFVEKGE